MPSSESAAAFAFEQLQPLPGTLTVTGGVQDVLAAASQQAEAVREQARLAGAAEGRAAALAAARADLAPAVAALGEALAGVAQLRDQIVEQVERDAVALALRLAEQVVCGAIAAQPERVLDVVRGALRRLTQRTRVTILVNPADLELVSDALGDVCGELGGIDHAEAQADRRVARGGAVVRTAEGTLDAQIDSQLARAQQIVAQELAA